MKKFIAAFFCSSQGLCITESATTAISRRQIRPALLFKYFEQMNASRFCKQHSLAARDKPAPRTALPGFAQPDEHGLPGRRRLGKSGLLKGWAGTDRSCSLEEQGRQEHTCAQRRLKRFFHFEPFAVQSNAHPSRNGAGCFLVSHFRPFACGCGEYFHLLASAACPGAPEENAALAGGVSKLLLF